VPPRALRSLVAGWCASLAIGLAWCSIGLPGTPGTANAASIVRTEASLIDQGRYLATAGDCISCHTRPNGVPFAGGLPLTTPFGVIYSANITPDLATGIGGWSEQQFARALHEGIAADGRHLYPAFPYTAYTKVTDQDVHAIYAYLRSLKPVSYRPPPSEMRFPFNVRGLLASWNLLYLQPGRYVPDPARSAEWNRGAYLVQGLGHCGSCHTPRDFLGGERTSQALTGGAYRDEIADEVINDRVTPMDERTVRLWSAANLTQASTGLAGWTVDEIATYLKSGHNARAGAFGPMSVVIANSTSRLTAGDIRAMAVYLKSLPPPPQPEQSNPDEERRRAGEIVYTTRCGDCHQSTGLGMPRNQDADPSKTAPPLAGNPAVQAPDPASLINVVLYGAHEAVLNSESWPKMSGFELSVGLDDEQIAALCTYVRSSWGNHAGPVDAADVAKQH
jgi:mono/diheme cytochrome c family protein